MVTVYTLTTAPCPMIIISPLVAHVGRHLYCIQYYLERVLLLALIAIVVATVVARHLRLLPRSPPRVILARDKLRRLRSRDAQRSHLSTTPLSSVLSLHCSSAARHKHGKAGHSQARASCHLTRLT